MSSSNYLLPDFKPFQSSGGTCYPSTDYRAIHGGKKKRSSSKKRTTRKTTKKRTTKKRSSSKRK